MGIVSACAAPRGAGLDADGPERGSDSGGAPSSNEGGRFGTVGSFGDAAVRDDGA
jgi:hypothetical protein